MLNVGLTGGIASGKSTVAGLLARHGALVIDSDALAREAVAAGTDGLAEVVAAFGEGVLTADGSLDRPALGRLVFGDTEARRRLESIIHPRVRARSAALVDAADADAVIVHDIPLLVETGQADDFDAVLVVDVPAELQVHRLVAERGMDAADAEARVAAQATRDERLAAATYVIDNAGTLDDLQARVDEVWQALARD